MRAYFYHWLNTLFRGSIGRECRPLQRLLDIETTSNHLLANLVERVPCPSAQGTNDTIVARIGTQFAANAKQRRKPGSFEQLEPVMLNLILKAGVTTCIQRPRMCRICALSLKSYLMSRRVVNRRAARCGGVNAADARRLQSN